MRLINVSTFILHEFFGESIPPYAILSHRWQEDELTYQDIEAGTQTKKKGYQKVRDTCDIAKNHGLDWLWSDTCCIDQKNSVELNENINRMYKFYKHAVICITYLADHNEGVTNLADSLWFTRCWTLQELIAPSNVHFYDSEWCHIGTKKEMSEALAEITGIPAAVLSGRSKIREYSIAQRMSWASRRKAKFKEDEAYSLLGIFGVHMPTSYGIEGEAFRELQKLLAQKHDHSLFAWSTPGNDRSLRGLLAESPAAFSTCGYTDSCGSLVESIGCMGDGIMLETQSMPYALGIYACFLQCSSRPGHRDVIFLQQLDQPQLYARIMLSNSTNTLRFPDLSEAGRGEFRSVKKRKFIIPHTIQHEPLKIAPCVVISGLEGFDDLVAMSREGDVLDATGSEIILTLPENSWGTAGALLFSIREHRFRDANIVCLLFGVDADFSLHFRVSLRQGTLEDQTLEVSTLLGGVAGDELTKMVRGGWIYGYDKEIGLDDGQAPYLRGSMLRWLGEGSDHFQADFLSPHIYVNGPFHDVQVQGWLEHCSEEFNQLRSWRVNILPREKSTIHDVTKRFGRWLGPRLDALFPHGQNW